MSDLPNIGWKFWLQWSESLTSHARAQISDQAATFIIFVIAAAFAYAQRPTETVLACVWVYFKPSCADVSHQPLDYTSLPAPVQPMRTTTYGTTSVTNNGAQDRPNQFVDSSQALDQGSVSIAASHQNAIYNFTIRERAFVLLAKSSIPRRAVLLIWCMLAFVVSLIPYGDIALSSSSTCGMFTLSEKATIWEKNTDDVYRAGKERRAGQYAKTCYEQENVTEPLGCNLFYHPRFKFSTIHTKCPFFHSNVCLGTYSAVTFSTGIVDGTLLGINARIAPRFRRQTTCSPLNIGDEYVTSQHDPIKNQTIYSYWYGSKDNSQATFQMAGDLFSSGVPAYSVNAYTASPWDELNSWHPIAALGRPPNTYLTIMFIATGHIFYEGPSNDLIFHADEPCLEDDDCQGLYRSTGSRARALACIDLNEICAPNSDECWPMFDTRAPRDRYSIFLRFALLSSRIYDAIQNRLGSALLAQDLVSQYRSQQLSGEHWIKEAKILFETSLARLSFDALDIATGADSSRPGYEEVHYGAERPNFCGIYMLKLTSGFKNMNLVAYLFVLAFLMFLWVCGSRKRVRVQDSDGEEAYKEVLILEWIYRSALRPSGEWAYHRIMHVRQHVKEWLKQGTSRAQYEEL